MDKEKVKNFIVSQRQNGVPDEQIYSFLQEKGAITAPDKPQSFTGLESSPFQATGEEGAISGTAKFIGNIPSSGLELGKNIFSAVTSPIETTKAIVDVVKGTGAKASEMILEKTDFGQKLLEKANQDRIAKGLPELKKDEAGKFQVEETPELKTINQVGQILSDRYGSIDKFKETVIEDPVGVLADLSTILTGGASMASTLGKASVATKIAEVARAIEPITAVTKATSKIKSAVSGSKAGQIVSEIIPTVSDIQRSQVVKALDLTQSDLSNISKATGNDVTEFIVAKQLIKDTPEQVADALNVVRKDTKKLVRDEIAKVTNTYTQKDIPTVRSGLQVILQGVDGVVGLEDVASSIKKLSNKKKYTLSDIQVAKELIDENSSIYSKIGDTKSGATARGLDKVRKDIRAFIEDEVTKATDGKTNISRLNNDVSTSFAIEDAINTRATRNLTRQKVSLSDMTVGIGGSAVFSPAVGFGLYLGKKLIETPSFRLAFVKALDVKPIAKVKKLLREVKDRTMTKESQLFLDEIADEARKNLPVIESSSNLLQQLPREEQ